VKTSRDSKPSTWSNAKEVTEKVNAAQVKTKADEKVKKSRIKSRSKTQKILNLNQIDSHKPIYVGK
jgi:hypothetical protein